MNRYIHGGDVSDILYDFSVNTNPLGIHEDVAKAIKQAILAADKYPEYGALALVEKLAKTHNVAKNSVLVTAGASEAFVGICRALAVKKGAIVDPGFYGYEYALTSVEAHIKRYIYEDILREGLQLEEDLQVLFLCNPNNPDGRIISAKTIDGLIKKAAANGTYVILDECFLPLSDIWQNSFINKISEYNNLIIVRAFTKSFALAGVRLGYIICRNPGLVAKIGRTLPEWNVSGPALAAGLEALDHLDYLDEARQLIFAERRHLVRELSELGFAPSPSAANFILFEGATGLKEELLKTSILIRDCSNYHRLQENSYRIAVLTREKNDYLLVTLRELLRQQQIL